MSLITTADQPAASGGGFWDTIGQWGIGIGEYLGEAATGIADTWLELEIIEEREKRSVPDVVKNFEPVKGTTTDGRPIVTNQTANGQTLSGGGFTIDTNTALIVGAVALVAVLALRK